MTDEEKIAEALTKYFSEREINIMGDEIPESHPMEYTSTGSEKLDEYIGGGLPHGLTVIAAAPGTGKSQSLLSIAVLMGYKAHKENKRILYISCENYKNSDFLAIDRYRNKYKTRPYMTYINIAEEDISPFYVTSLFAEAAKYDIVLIDSPEMLICPNDGQDYIDASRELVKKIHKLRQATTCVICSWQLNSAGITALSKVTLANLAYSMEIARKADLILALGYEDTRRMMKVMKNRNGSIKPDYWQVEDLTGFNIMGCN